MNCQPQINRSNSFKATISRVRMLNLTKRLGLGLQSPCGSWDTSLPDWWRQVALPCPLLGANSATSESPSTWRHCEGSAVLPAHMHTSEYCCICALLAGRCPHTGSNLPGSHEQGFWQVGRCLSLEKMLQLTARGFHIDRWGLRTNTDWSPFWLLPCPAKQSTCLAVGTSHRTSLNNSYDS